MRTAAVHFLNAHSGFCHAIEQNFQHVNYVGTLICDDAPCRSLDILRESGPAHMPFNPAPSGTKNAMAWTLVSVS